MTHHVGVGQLADTDAFHLFQHPHGLPQAGGLAVRQIDLGHVAGNDDLGAEAQPGQEHFHLLPAGVLGLVQNDETIVQGPAAHVGQGGHLDVAPLQILLVGLCPQHVEQGVVQRPEVRVHLALQIAGQEAQPLAGLHRRTGEDDAVHLLFPEGLHCRRHRQIRFAGTGGAYADGNGIFQHRRDIFLLAQRFRLHRAALGGDAQHIPRQLADLLLFAGADHVNDIADVLLSQRLPPGGQGQHGLHRFGGVHHVLRLAADPQLAVPVGHRHIKFLFQQADVLVKGAENIDCLLHPLNADPLFHAITPKSYPDAPSGSFAV